jgi:hypothetical protein
VSDHLPKLLREATTWDIDNAWDGGTSRAAWRNLSNNAADRIEALEAEAAAERALADQLAARLTEWVEWYGEADMTRDGDGAALAAWRARRNPTQEPT